MSRKSGMCCLKSIVFSQVIEQSLQCCNVLFDEPVLQCILKRDIKDNVEDVRKITEP
jgi:hypothetical protein